MDAASKFCGTCGAPLGRDVRFCGECGTAVNAKAGGSPNTATDSSKSPENKTSLSAVHLVGSKRRKWVVRGLLLFSLVVVCSVVAWWSTFYLVEEVAPRFVHALAWSPDEKQLISAGPDHAIQLWDGETGDALKRVDLGAIKSVNAAAWSQDGKFIAVADSKQINFYQLPDLHFFVSIPTGTDHPIALCFDPNGTNLYTMSGDFAFSVWDYQQQQRLGGIPGLEESSINAAKFSGDCRRLLTLETVQGNQLLSVYQRINMETLMTQTFTGYSEQVDEAGLNSTGTRVLTASSDTLKVWTVDSGKLYGNKELDSFYITSMATGSRDTRLALGGSEGRIRIYDKQGTLLRKLQHGSGLGLAVLPLAHLF